MVDDIGTVFRDFNNINDPASGEYEPEKPRIRGLLRSIRNSSGLAITRNTLAALTAVTPPTEDYMGVVLDDPDPSNNGYYSRVAAAWVWERGFPDTFARVTLGGTANAQTGDVAAGVDPASTEVFFATVGTDNTGPMTLSIDGETARGVVNAAGNALTAGEWTGSVLFFLNSDGEYQLLINPGAEAAAAASASAAYAAQLAAEAAAATAGDGLAIVSSRTVMAGLDYTIKTGARLTEAGRAGDFYWVGTDLSPLVTIDTLQGVYVAPISDPTGGSGAWVRMRDPDTWEPKWFGAACDAATNDGPVYAVIHALAKNGDTILMPVGLSGISPANRLQFTKSLSIVGKSKNASGFYGLGFTTDVAIMEDQGTTGDRIQNIRRENFCIRSDNSLARGWNATWVNKSNFKNLYFYDLYNGFAGDNAWSNTWENCDGFGIAKSQILLFDECNHNTFTSCAFVGHRGVRVLGGLTALVFNNCDFEGILSDAGTPGAGVLIAPGSGDKVRGIVFNGGYWEGIDGYAIQASPTDALAVEGLDIRGAYIYGAHASADIAISLSNTTGFTIENCKFEDWDVAAIAYTTTAINGRIANNVCDTATVPALTNSSNLMHYSVEIINNTYGRKVQWDTSMPSAGSYTQGDYVHNIAPTKDANNMVLKGWDRLTTGSGHVLGTDWSRDYASHLSPAT